MEPEQITINIGDDAKIPIPPKGHKWAEVRHDNTVTWLATWNENINGATKYVFLAAGSSLKGQSDLAKYEKARKLKVRSIPKRKVNVLAPYRYDPQKLHTRFERRVYGNETTCHGNVSYRSICLASGE